MQESINLQKQEKLFQCPIDEEFVALMVGKPIIRNRKDISEIQEA
jgi:hypothetical protein